jgi:ribosome biogenesis GTPase
MGQGIVYKSTGSWYTVKDESGAVWNTRIKGIMKLDGITSTNPIAVGDTVHFDVETEGENVGIIHKIEDRRNYINRQSPRHKHQHHIVAANLDQSLLLATLKNPRTSQGFIDRFLVACEMYHVPALLVYNKADLYRKKEMALYEELQAMYAGIGYAVFLISVQEEKGLTELKEMLQQKTTLISGHSGVGKSSFINAVLPHTGIRTQNVSGWSGKGMHTTTFAEMYDLPFGGKIIDTPGMREFGLIDLERSELSGYFPEMRLRLAGCRFNNCLHLNEPDCAITAAVQEGAIHENRYISYVSILESLPEHAR